MKKRFFVIIMSLLALLLSANIALAAPIFTGQELSELYKKQYEKFALLENNEINVTGRVLWKYVNPESSKYMLTVWQEKTSKNSRNVFRVTLKKEDRHLFSAANINDIITVQGMLKPAVNDDKGKFIEIAATSFRKNLHTEKELPIIPALTAEKISKLYQKKSKTIDKIQGTTIKISGKITDIEYSKFMKVTLETKANQAYKVVLLMPYVAGGQADYSKKHCLTVEAYGLLDGISSKDDSTIYIYSYNLNAQ